MNEEWFAARTRDKQEFEICRILDRLKAEDAVPVEYYLPVKTVLRQLKYRRKRVKVPVISNLIFIHTTRQTAIDVLNKHSVPVFYMKDLFTHRMLVVPDKQMDDFRFVMDLSPDGVNFDTSTLVVGSKVQVIKGDFTGVEGEVATDSGKTFVVIRMTGILSASIKVPKSYLKILK